MGQINIKNKQMSVNMGEIYDKHAENFAQLSPQLITWKYVGSRAFDKLLPEYFNDQSKILDLGCASGRVEDYLIDHGVSPRNIMGVEISPDQVEIAMLRFPDVAFRIGDISTIDLPQNTFDVAISHMVFEHLDQEGLEATLTNAHGALKDDGKLVFVVTHPGKMKASDGVDTKGWFETSAPWGGTVKNYYREIEDFEQAVTNAGFEIESIEGVEIPEDAKAEDPTSYQKYKSYGPIRLAIKAIKNARS